MKLLAKCIIRAFLLGSALLYSRWAIAAPKAPFSVTVRGTEIRCNFKKGKWVSGTLSAQNHFSAFSSQISALRLKIARAPARKKVSLRNRLARVLELSARSDKSCRNNAARLSGAAPTATVTPTPTATPTPQMTSAISQYGVTFTFDRSYRYGQFANGDYWISPIAPGETVRIVSISPDYNGKINGWESNPHQTNSNGSQTGLDFRLDFYNASLVPALPYDAHAGESIVKAVSIDESIAYSGNPLLMTAVVLTVLDSPLLGNGADYFRPPYYSTEKPLFKVSDLRVDALPALPVPTSAPSIDTVADNYQRVQLEHFGGWAGRPMHPYLNMPAYGGTISERNSNSVLSLFLDHPAEKRLRAIVNFVQYGIDLGYIARHSGPYMWAPEGGHGTGRPVPMLFAGLLLNSQEILDGTKFAGPMRFSEWGAVNYRANAGQPLWGQVTEVFSITEPRELSYWHGLIRDLVNHSAIEDPYGYIDGGTRPGDYYQNWIINEKGSALAVHLLQHYSFPETLTNFNNDTYLTFMDRWVQFGAVTSPDVCAPPEGVWLAGPQMGTHCTTAEESATPLWARTIQDECGFGVCFDGPFTGQPCGPFFGPGTASTSTRCGKDGNNVEYRCALNSQHGVTYGYQGTGSCIADVDPSDGIGRFPQFHGFNRDGTAVAVPGFKDEMWATYRAQASH